MPGGERRRAGRDHARAGPKRPISRPATRKENSGTISGPGAIARPVCSADHPQTSCSHSTTDRSIAPNAAENSSATARGAGERCGRETACGPPAATRARAQCATNSASVAGGQGEHGDRARGAPAPAAALDEPERERRHAAGDQHGAERIGTRTGMARERAGRSRQPADERGEADRHVHEEDQAPARVDEHAADDRAERGREPADRGPGADRAVAAFGRGRGEHEPERGRRQQRRARGLHDAEADEHRHARGGAAGGRRAR